MKNNLFIENHILPKELIEIVRSIYESKEDYNDREYGLLVAGRNPKEYKGALIKGTADKISKMDLNKINNPIEKFELKYGYVGVYKLYFFHNHPKTYISAPSNNDMRIALLAPLFDHYVFACHPDTYQFLFANTRAHYNFYKSERGFDNATKTASICLSNKGQELTYAEKYGDDINNPTF